MYSPVSSPSVLENDPRHRLAPWRGEFADRAQERAYRDSSRTAWGAQIRLAAALLGVMFVLWGYSDYNVFGFSREFFWLMLCRLVTFGMAVGAIFATRRAFDHRHVDWWVSAFQMALLLSGVLVIFLKKDIALQTAASSTFSIVLFYLLLPNRFVLTAGFSLGGSVILTWATFATGSIDDTRVVGLVLLLVACNVLGLAAALRNHETQRRQFAALEHATATTIRLRDEIEQRQRLERELYHLGRSDPLTGTLSLRALSDECGREMQRAIRSGRFPSVLLVTVNHFRAITETLSHTAGDEVLVGLTGLCRQVLRETDLLARIGGEEFAALLLETDEEGARIVAERLQAAVTAAPLPLAGEDGGSGGSARVTVSVGVAAARNPSDGLDLLLHRAELDRQRADVAG